MCDGAEKTGEQGRGELRGGAAADIDGADGLEQPAVARVGGQHVQLGAYGFDIFGGQLGERGGVETAVDAAAPAEGDMDIESGHACFFIYKV